MSFAGKYERVSAENYEEFLKGLDVNFLLRKAATVSTPVMEVRTSGIVGKRNIFPPLRNLPLSRKIIIQELSDLLIAPRAKVCYYREASFL